MEESTTSDKLTPLNQAQMHHVLTLETQKFKHQNLCDKPESEYRQTEAIMKRVTTFLIALEPGHLANSEPFRVSNECLQQAKHPDAIRQQHADGTLPEHAHGGIQQSAIAYIISTAVIQARYGIGTKHQPDLRVLQKLLTVLRKLISTYWDVAKPDQNAINMEESLGFADGSLSAVSARARRRLVNETNKKLC